MLQIIEVYVKRCPDQFLVNVLCNRYIYIMCKNYEDWGKLEYFTEKNSETLTVYKETKIIRILICLIFPSGKHHFAIHILNMVSVLSNVTHQKLNLLFYSRPVMVNICLFQVNFKNPIYKVIRITEQHFPSIYTYI